MEAKTALELWNDGVEGRLNMQLYHCDVDTLVQEPKGGVTSSQFSLCLDSASYKIESFDEILRDIRMIPPGPDSSSEAGDVKLQGRVTPPLHLFDYLDPPTYEESLKQIWELFEHSDQETERSCPLKDVPEKLELLDSPKVICSVVPDLEPTCLTSVIQAMVMYPPVKKVPKKKERNWGRHRRTRPPRKTANEVRSEVGDSPGGILGCKDFQDFYQSKQSVDESEFSVRESLLATPATPQVLPTRPIAASEFFAEHLARCAVDWDYPEVLFSIGGYEAEPVSQKRAPLQTRTTSLWPGSAQPMTSLALEQKSTLAFGASNVFSRNKRHASANLSSDLPRSPDVLGLENVESGTKLALRQNKRRRVIT